MGLAVWISENDVPGKTWEDLLEEANPEMAVKYELMRAEYYRSRNMDSLEAKALESVKFCQEQMK